MTGSTDAGPAGAQLDFSTADDPAVLGVAPLSPDGPVFARHGTFHPRSGWLKKGYDAAVRDPDVFAKEDAPVTLGVGKNMVRAIRYWCHAFGVLQERDGGGSRPTPFGDRLLGPDGLDPYLEDVGSLWRLHWTLLREGGLATAWRFAFFEYARPEFTTEELADALAEYAHRAYPGARSAAESSLRKDAACFTRMYGGHGESGGRDREAAPNEESLRCPFAALGLLRPAALRRAFAFHVGAKPGLSGDLVTAACLEYTAARPHRSRTVSVATLARGTGAPGLAFRLGEGALYAALEQAAAAEPALTLADAGGIVQLAVRGGEGAAYLRALAQRCVERHYAAAGRVSSRASSRPSPRLAVPSAPPAPVAPA